MQGQILESQQKYQEAIKVYAKAFEVAGGKRVSAAVRLAFCHLQERQHISCVDVCKRALLGCPGHGQLEEILRAALAAVRY